jgi:hypothetical protein
MIFLILNNLLNLVFIFLIAIFLFGIIFSIDFVLQFHLYLLFFLSNLISLLLIINFLTLTSFYFKS